MSEMGTVGSINQESLEKYVDALDTLVADVELSNSARQEFENSPCLIFERYGIPDLQLVAEGKTFSLYSLVESANKDARVPVSRTICRRIRLANDPKGRGIELRTIPLLNAVFNANAVVTINMVANANAMVQANANFTYQVNSFGYGNPSVKGHTGAVILSDTYRNSALYEALDDEGVSIVRQAAALKSLIEDSLGSSFSGVASGIVRGEYRSLHFEVVYDIRRDSLEIKDARLLVA